MDWLILTLCGLVLYAVRDARGLAQFRDARLRALYALAVLATACCLGALAEEISRDSAQQLLRDAAFWGPALAIHVVLWLAFQRAKAAEHESWPRWLLLAPSPVLIYSLGGASWLSLLSLNLPGFAAGASVGAAYLAVVFGMVRLTRLRAGSWQGAMEFGAAANLAAFLLIPLHQESGESGLLTYAIDWAQTGAALGATALLVGASFLFHRLRSA